MISLAYPKRIREKTDSFFASLRMKNVSKKNKRTVEVYDKVKEIKEIDAEILKLGSEFAKSVLAKKVQIVSVYELKDKLNKLNARKIELLVDNGYDMSYLDDIFECDICKDTGVVDGKYCECYKNKIKEYAYLESNLPLLMDKRSFDDFNLELYPDDGSELSPKVMMTMIFEECKTYAYEFGKNSGNLLFYGGTGLGKTFLSSCIAKVVLDNGASVFYQPAYRIFNIFEENKFGTETDKSLLKLQISDIYESDLLIIDDLGTEMITAYTSEILFDLINTRMNNNKSMIISTNLSFSELEKVYSPRITSRLQGNFTPLKFCGEDIRRK